MKGSMVSAEVVEPYAEALMSLAKSANLTERIGEDVRSLLSMLQNSPELQGVLASPVIKQEIKKSVLQQLAGGGLHAYTLSFLMLLVDRRRIIFLDGVCQKYLAFLRELNQTVLAEVISAVELTAAQRQTVADKVKAMTGAQQVELDAKLESELIGGVIIKVGSQVIDASLRGQLRRISISLSNG